MTNNDYEVDLQMSDIKTYEDIQRGKPIHSDGVMAHIGIVKRVASHLRGRLPEYMGLDELVQVGMIGLIEATKTFDDTKGVDFELFAKNRIRGAILDEVRKLSPLPRSAISTVREHSEATQRLTSELGRQPTNAEMADHLGKDIESFEKDRTHAHRFQTESLDAQPAETLDKPADHANEPENLVEKEQLIEEVAGAIDKLPERERMVMSLYYVEEMNLKEIGAVLDVSESRISQILSGCVKSLRTKLEIETNDKG